MVDVKLEPHINRSESGRVARLERFSHYVARQIGFDDPNECPQLCKLANDYLKKTEGCESNIFEFLANLPDTELIYVKLIEELDRCILTYFSFHWTHTSLMINQVLGENDIERKTQLKELVMAATRKQRFERVMKNLKVARVFSTLLEEMKAIGGITTGNGSNGEAKCTEVMVPMAHNQRSPVLLLMGGGMGAGKTTVLKDILKEPFWSGVAAKAVVVEADAFKETDVIYRALSSSGHHGDMLQTAELVHQSSTDAASSLLVTALNEGRDVIMDGTMSWPPFVEQTVDMARNVHKWRYRMGVGYKVAEDGTVTEKYWERVEDDDDEESGKQEKGRKPYRIELVGVVCDAHLAVVRAIRRAIMVKRAVRVKSQLKSHQKFATAFRNYAELVDNARLYCTNTVCGPPRLIGWKDGASRLLVDVEEIVCLKTLSELNVEADSIYQLHLDPSPSPSPSPSTHMGSAWNHLVLCPSRPNIQNDLLFAIQKCEVATL
ncbi:hypothetical protein vseg_017113 [Gypsophila vaccaria]